MRTPRSHAWPRRHPWLVALLLALPLLGIYCGDAGPLGAVRDGLGPATAQADEAQDRARFEQAGVLIEEGRYREAVELLGTRALAGVPERELRLRRATAQLRWTALPGVDEPEVRAASERALVELLETGEDDVAAFAWLELARAGSRTDVLARLREQTLAHWEASTDLQRAGRHYADLALVLLERGEGGMHADEHTLLRMWENLVAAPVDEAQLQEFASRVLVNAPTVPVGRRAWVITSDWRYQSVLAPRVARDVLKRNVPDWLRAEAHAELGFDATQKGRFAEAVEHFRAVLSLVKAEDARAAQQVRAMLDEIVTPKVQLAGEQLYRPGSDHRVSLTWRNLRAWELTVRRVDPVADLRLPLNALSQHHPVRGFDASIGEEVLRRSRTDEVEERARTREDRGGARHVVRTADLRLDALDPGVYVVELAGTAFEGEPVPELARQILVVTRWGVVQQDRFDAVSGREVSDYWLVGMDDGRPTNGVDLTVHRGVVAHGGDKVNWSTERVRTDTDGRAQLPRIAERQVWQWVVGVHQGHPIFFPGQSWWFGGAVPERSDLRGMVWTDRPLYRPGETVNVQIFARRMDARARAIAVPAGQTLKIEIRDPRGEMFHERELQLDANGSFDFALPIGSDVALGEFRVQVLEPSGSMVTLGNFAVDEYRLPEFTVSVQLDTERRYVLGDTLHVDVDAAYLFGGPVQGTAEVVVRREPVWTIWKPVCWLPWTEEETPMQRGRILPPVPFGGGEEILRTTLALDAQGRARLSIATERRDSEPGDFRYTMEARVTDSSRREESGTGTITVGERELVAFLRSVRHVVAPGDRAEVTLRVQDVMGRGVAHDGTWELVRVDDANRSTSLRTEPVTTDDNGEATLRFVPEREGHYRVVYRSIDGRGMDLQAETVVWVADPRTRDLPYAAGAIDLVVERDEFLGDTARVLLVSDTPGAPVLLTRTHAGGSEVQLVRMKGTAQLLEIPLDDLHRPSFSLHAMRVRGWRVHEAQVHVVAPQAARLVQLELAFEKEDVEPGSTTPLRVRALDASGEPIATILSIAVVDQALLQLKQRQGLDPIALFHRFPTAPEPRRTLLARGLGRYAELDEDDLERDEEGVQLRSEELSGGSRALKVTDTMVAAQGNEFAARAPDAAGAEIADALSAGAGFQPTSVRTDFRTTALWRTNIRTGADGYATIDVPLAQSLTTWNATVLALDPQTRTGVGEVTVRTRKPVMVRLNHPRVFRERDAFTVAAVVHNEHDEAIDAEVQLVAEDLQLQPRTQRVRVQAHGQARVEWEVAVPNDRLRPVVVRDDLGRVLRTEPASLKLQAAVRTERGDDAFERIVPLLAFGSGVHVASITEQKAGRGELSITLPSDRLAGSETYTLTVAPSLLSTAIEALPYLAQFPYGCTEQTLSRFVPAVAVRAAAERLGARSSRIDPELDAKVRKGLQAMASMQNADGGWAWWKDGTSDPYITSYAVVALARAKREGVDVDRGLLTRGRDALRAMLPRVDRRPDDLAYALLALVEADRVLQRDGEVRTDEAMQRWANDLFGRRDRHTAYARALTARVLFAYGELEKARLVLRHLGNDVQRDRVLGTAHWGRRSGYWWRGEGATETTAFVLQAMVEIESDHALRDEVARWIAHDRRGHRWDSTRSTAHAIYALCDHIAGTDADQPEYTLIARVGDQELVRVIVTPKTLLEAGGRFELPTSLLRDGTNRVQLELVGKGTAWVTLETDLFTRAERIAAQGHVLEIEREVIRLVPQRTLGQGIVTFEQPLVDGDVVHSGDRLRVRLKLRARHDVEYVMIEDPRPAGAEPVEQLSGTFWSAGLSGRREVRDDRTAFFLSQITQGEASIEYELRAESPGVFRVAPARAAAMYLPDVAGHSSSGSVRIVAQEQKGQ
jgi:alpha-2-macroglobulin